MPLIPAITRSFNPTKGRSGPVAEIFSVLKRQALHRAGKGRYGDSF